MHTHISLVQRLIRASFSPKPPGPSHLTNGVVHCPAAAQGPLQGSGGRRMCSEVPGSDEKVKTEEEELFYSISLGL